MVSSRGRRRPRGVKRKMSSYPLRPRAPIRNDRRKVEISMLLSEIDSIGASRHRGFPKAPANQSIPERLSAG